METISLEQTSSRLSLAVGLRDDFTGRQPIGEVRLAVSDREGIKNPSGYYLFLDLPAGDFQLRVRAQYYFDQEVDITLTPPGEPVSELILKPSPAYPFPERATLIRGMVGDTEGEPVAGAAVRIKGREVASETTERGEFALYFKGLTEADIIKINGKRYVTGNGRQKLSLQVTHPSYPKKTAKIEVEEGKTTFVSMILRKEGG